MRLMRVRGRWRVVLTRAEETLATLSPANSELRFAKNSTEEPRSELGICLGFVVWAAPPNGSKLTGLEPHAKWYRTWDAAASGSKSGAAQS